MLNLVEALRDEFEFYVVTRNTDYTSSVPYSEVQPDEWNILPQGISVYYISQQHLNKHTIARLLRERNYDHVYLNSMWSKPFTLWPLAETVTLNPKPKVTLAVRGMLAPSALAIKGLKKKMFLWYARLFGVYRDVCFHATNEAEAEHVRNVFGAAVRLIVAPNLPRRRPAIVQHHQHKKAGSVQLITVARIAPEKNILFALEVLRYVNAEVNYSIYGAVYDAKYFDACRRTAVSLPPNVNVTFSGAIGTDNIPDVLSRHDLMFLPSRGENFGHIILESLQSGTPVLISDQTPWRYPEMQKAGWVIPLRDQKEFAKIIDRVAAFTEEELQNRRKEALTVAEKYASDSELLNAGRKLFE